jgi:hypothetical protein
MGHEVRAAFAVLQRAAEYEPVDRWTHFFIVSRIAQPLRYAAMPRPVALRFDDQLVQLRGPGVEVRSGGWGAEEAGEV